MRMEILLPEISTEDVEIVETLIRFGTRSVSAARLFTRRASSCRLHPQVVHFVDFFFYDVVSFVQCYGTNAMEFHPF